PDTRALLMPHLENGLGDQRAGQRRQNRIPGDADRRRAVRREGRDCNLAVLRLGVGRVREVCRGCGGGAEILRSRRRTDSAGYDAAGPVRASLQSIDGDLLLAQLGLAAAQLEDAARAPVAREMDVRGA